MRRGLVLSVLPMLVLGSTSFFESNGLRNVASGKSFAAVSSDELSCRSDNDIDFSFKKQFELHFSLSNESFDFSVIKDGVGLEIRRNGRQMTAIAKPHKEKSKLIFEFVYGNEVVTKSFFFFSKDMNLFFGSEISMEEAEIFYSKSFENNDIGNPMSEISTQTRIDIGPILVTNCLTGKLQWKDDKGNTFPLRNVNVAIHSPAFMVSSDPLIDSKFGTTDDNGLFSIPLNSAWQRVRGTNVTMKVKLRSSLASIYSDNSKSEVYVFTKQFKLNDLADDNLNQTFSSTTMFGQAAQVFEAIDSYAKYAENLCGKTESVDVVYPATNISTDCYYSKNSGEFKEKTIYIGYENGKKDSKTDYVAPNSYASWDMLGHEYGHHIQNLYHLTVFNGGDHCIDGNNVKVNKANYPGDDRLIKNNQLTWKESWPTYFAFCAQERFDSIFKNIAFVNDSDYNASNIYYPVCIVAHGDESFKVHGPQNIDGGEACEASVIRFLCHLENKMQNAFDRFSLEDKVIWDFINEYPIEEFYDFYSFMEDEGYSMEDVGLLINACGIGISVGYDSKFSGISFGALAGVEGLTKVKGIFTLYDANKNVLWTNSSESAHFLNLFEYRSRIFQASPNGTFYVSARTTNYLNGIARTRYDTIIKYTYLQN